MRCPSCGGYQRRILAPGLYQCTSPVEVMGYMRPPGPMTGPVRLVPGPELRVCGHQYHDLASDSSVELCRCGMGAVADCVECHRRLCDLHVVWRDGRVFCSDDAATLDDAAATRRLRATLDRVAARVSVRTDPNERALLLFLCRDGLPDGTTGLMPGRLPEELVPGRLPEESVDPVAEDRSSRGWRMVHDLLFALLPDATVAFTYSAEINWLELTSGSAFAAWAFAHPDAPRPTRLPVVRLIRHAELLSLPLRHVSGLLVAGPSYEEPSGDFPQGRYIPPSYLLESGAVVGLYNGYLQPGEVSATPSPSEYDKVVAALHLDSHQ